ncbi:MAG: hypothetical protein M3396_02135 [Actinomycetota bacterium]|nr:hypothetical protein [Actinomycetota bacterium]
MTSTSWEGRHPGRWESWAFDFFTAGASLGGFVGLSFHPDLRRCWYWAALVGDRRRYLLVRDLDVPLPRLAASREIRSEALWADMNCETPFEHWSIGLEAFGVAMDDPDEALRTERGERLGLGLDIEWEAVGEIEGAEGSYEQPGIVHGEVLVGGAGVETIAFEGHGWRRHAWGDPPCDGPDRPGSPEGMLAPRSWLGGRLDDGTPHRLQSVGHDVDIEALHRAPLLLEADVGEAILERWLCRFRDPSVGGGTGWVEWTTPRPR